MITEAGLFKSCFKDKSLANLEVSYKQNLFIVGKKGKIKFSLDNSNCKFDCQRITYFLKRHHHLRKKGFQNRNMRYEDIILQGKFDKSEFCPKKGESILNKRI